MRLYNKLIALSAAVALVFLFSCPTHGATLAEKRYKTFHILVVWPMRIVGYGLAGPIMIPVILAEHFDKELEKEAK